MLLLLADGTQVPVAELPGQGPWTFLVLQPDPARAPRHRRQYADFQALYAALAPLYHRAGP